jgi:DNA-binding response OmpR family regulator
MKRVLIIDDDEAILEAMKIAIQREGYEVHTYIDGDNIIDKILFVKPDIVLLDLLLSGKDGSELVKEVKAENGLSQVPIIMISAHPSAKDMALKSGVDHFLAKPFDLDELFKVVGKFTAS